MSIFKIIFFIFVFITPTNTFIFNTPYNKFSYNIKYNKLPSLRLSSYNNTYNNNIINNNNYTIEKGYHSSYKPIKKISIDDLFKEVYNIYILYISSNNDKVIIEYKNKKRNIVYINNETDNKMMDIIIRSTKNIKKKIICDITNTIDDIYGYLYNDNI